MVITAPPLVWSVPALLLNVAVGDSRAVEAMRPQNTLARPAIYFYGSARLTEKNRKKVAATSDGQ